MGPLLEYVFAVRDVFKIKGSTYIYRESNGHPKWLESHEPDEFTSNAILKALEAGADLVGFYFGSDYLSCVRVPASYNGVLGMCPTYERIPKNGIKRKTYNYFKINKGGRFQKIN